MAIPLTVALLTYNRSHYLREAIDGVLSQTYTDFEFLVLDNGSTDDTADVVLAIDDPRLRYVRNPPGMTAGFNALSAMLLLRGERLLVTHDDDVMEPEMLARQMAVLRERPDVTAVWTNTSVIDEHGATIQQHLTPPRGDRIYDRGEYIARYAHERRWYPPSGLIYTPSLLSQANLNAQYRNTATSRRRSVVDGSGDVVLPALMNTKGPVAFVDAPLLRYRQHGVQETNRISLSDGVLHLYKVLARLVADTPYGEAYRPLFASLIARYQAQHELIYVERPVPLRSTVSKLAKLLDRAAGGVASNRDAGYPLLPLAVLLDQLDAPGAPLGLLDVLPPPPLDDPASTHAMYAWAQRRVEGKNLFDSLPAGSRIAILGSVFVSAMLIMEARQRGIEVTRCLDSNVTRQGRELLGVPIVALAWLGDRDEPIDQIVVSSERDHEDEVVEMLRRHDPDTPVVSWKTLAG